jgi:hypothetical protein
MVVKARESRWIELGNDGKRNAKSNLNLNQNSVRDDESRMIIEKQQLLKQQLSHTAQFLDYQSRYAVTGDCLCDDRLPSFTLCSTDDSWDFDDDLFQTKIHF